MRRQRLSFLLFFLIQRSISFPQAGITVPEAPLPWITVNPAGAASTVSPKVITTEGHRTTLNAPPASLLSTSAWTLSLGSSITIYTGLSPVAGSTSHDEDGAAFLACSSNVGLYEPFCLPRAGSVLYPGRTYYITWSPSYFQPPSLQVSLSALYTPSGSNFSTKTGFTTPLFRADTGFYAWSIPPDFFTLHHPDLPSNVPLNVTFLLTYEDTTTSDISTDHHVRVGPSVWLLPVPDTAVPKKSGVNPLVIALPLSIVVVTMLGLGMCLLCYRRNGTVPIIGAVIRSYTGGGYGVKQSRAERTGETWQQQGLWMASGTGGKDEEKNKSETSAGVELTERESWGSSKKERNVFREEIARQERERP